MTTDDSRIVRVAGLLIRGGPVILIQCSFGMAAARVIQ